MESQRFCSYKMNINCCLQDLFPLNFLSVAAWEHGAPNVEQSITSCVAAEQPGLMSIINSQPVTVTQSQVSILVPDCSCSQLLISCHHSTPPHRHSLRSPCRPQWPSESHQSHQQWSPEVEQQEIPRQAGSPGIPPPHFLPEWRTYPHSTSYCPSHGSSRLPLITEII